MEKCAEHERDQQFEANPCTGTPNVRPPKGDAARRRNAQDTSGSKNLKRTRKMEASWHQNQSKIDANFERQCFEKSCWRCSGGAIFEVLGVEVGSKHPSKNDLNMKSTWEGILASIFNGFWWILGGKLGGKIEPRGIKNGIEKTMKKRRATRWPKSRNKRP